MKQIDCSLGERRKLERKKEEEEGSLHGVNKEPEDFRATQKTTVICNSDVLFFKFITKTGLKIC